MADIVLLHPDYPWPLKYPPLGLAYLASYLIEKGGYSVRIIDLAVERLPIDILKEELQKEDPYLIGISFMTCQAVTAYSIADDIRNGFSIPLVGGGVHVSALPKEAAAHFDYVIVGEGERSILELADCIVKEQSGYHEKIIQKNNFISDLDDIPFPAWRKLKLNEYKGLAKGLDQDKPFMVTLSSRGCPNYCTFCASHLVHGKKFRFRSPENIIEELVILNREFQISQFDFADDTMTVSRRRMVRLCHLILANELDISWLCNARVDSVDLELLKLMKQTGCNRVDFGVETGNEEIRRRINKNVTREQIIQAHRLAHEAGLETMSFFIIGLPGETRETVEETIRFAKELKTEYPGLSFATPFPGTSLYDVAIQNNWIDERTWDAYMTTRSGEHFLPVMEIEALTREELLELYEKVLIQFDKMSRR